MTRNVPSAPEVAGRTSGPGWPTYYSRLKWTIIANAVLSAALVATCLALMDHLPATVWNRVGTVGALSLFYLFLAFRLRNGSARALLRLKFSSVVGVIGVLLVIAVPGDGYPLWIRIEQAVQLLLLLHLAYIVYRPAVREHFHG
jgi:hypothetical protein